MLDLGRFSEQKYAIVPIVRGWGQYKRRRIYSPKTEDGWYLVSLGDKIQIGAKATPLEVEKIMKPLKKIRVFALGAEGVTMNFDTFKKRGLAEAVEVNFLDLPIFSVAEIVQWEDGRYYYYGQKIPKEQKVIREVRGAFERGQNLLELQGVTPELRFYFLLCSLQKQSFEAIRNFQQHGQHGSISAREIDKRVREFQSSFAGRLESAVHNAGAKFIKYSKSGKGYLVEWEIDGHRIKSTIKDNMQIISAGFCLSGDDKKHTVGSLINLAKLFTEESYLNITRE